MGCRHRQRHCHILSCRTHHVDRPPPYSCSQQPYVLPEHFFFPLDPEVGDVERPVGVLAVRVVRADNVRREGRRWLLCGVDAACAAVARSCHPCQTRSLQGVHCKVQLPPQTTSPRPLSTALSQVPKPGLLGSARPLLELFVRDSQRRQTHVAQLAGSSAAWGSRFEFPVSLPVGLGWAGLGWAGLGWAGLGWGQASGAVASWACLCCTTSSTQVLLPSLPMLAAEHQELTAILYDYSEFSPNDELGRAQLALRDLQPGREQEVTLLRRPKGEGRARGAEGTLLRHACGECSVTALCRDSRCQSNAHWHQQ